jgi:hypothetical protein
MNQFQFDLICKIIASGAPALANELCGALDNLVQSYNITVKELEQLKETIKEIQEVKANAKPEDFTK